VNAALHMVIELAPKFLVGAVWRRVVFAARSDRPSEFHCTQYEECNQLILYRTAHVKHLVLTVLQQLCSSSSRWLRRAAG